MIQTAAKTRLLTKDHFVQKNVIFNSMNKQCKYYVLTHITLVSNKETSIFSKNNQKISWKIKCLFFCSEKFTALHVIFLYLIRASGIFIHPRNMSRQNFNHWSCFKANKILCMLLHSSWQWQFYSPWSGDHTSRFYRNWCEW